MLLRKFQTWTYGWAPREKDKAVEYINNRLQVLERSYEELTRAASHGPLPGAYFTLTFHRQKSAALVAADETIPIRTNFNVTPLYFTAAVDTGSLTCQLRDGTTNLLMADFDTAAGSPWVNRLSAFDVVDKIQQTASLRVRVIGVTGAPTAIHAILVCSHVQKVDSPQEVV